MASGNHRGQCGTRTFPSPQNILMDSTLSSLSHWEFHGATLGLNPDGVWETRGNLVVMSHGRGLFPHLHKAGVNSDF